MFIWMKKNELRNDLAEAEEILRSALDEPHSRDLVISGYAELLHSLQNRLPHGFDTPPCSATKQVAVYLAQSAPGMKTESSAHYALVILFLLGLKVNEILLKAPLDTSCLELKKRIRKLFDQLDATRDHSEVTVLGDPRKAVDQEDAEAQFRLGCMYADGDGMPQNHVEAANWYRKAADQGYRDAQRYLGQMYDQGDGVPQDYTEAATWFRKAAEQGDVLAQFGLGAMCKDGRGVLQDYAEAIRWFRLAADQAEEENQLILTDKDGCLLPDIDTTKLFIKPVAADAQCILGHMYSQGQGVPQDYVESANWYSKAADHGNPVAQLVLGYMYSQGQGVPQDYVQAHKWFNLSVSTGNEEATTGLDLVAELMTPKQIAEAQRLAREWKHKTSQEALV